MLAAACLLGAMGRPGPGRALLGLPRLQNRGGSAQWEDWFDNNGNAIAAFWGEGSGETPAHDTILIEMKSIPDGRVGVNIVKGQCQVSRVLHGEAFRAGFRVGDHIFEVNGRAVASNVAVRQAVKHAVNAHKRSGVPLNFRVRRWSVKSSTRGMVKMTGSHGLDHVVPMVDLARGLVLDYPVVLFTEGELDGNLRGDSARAVRLLDLAGRPFKAVDCGNETANPGMRSALREMTGEEDLPQLFVAGRHLGGAASIARLHRSGELRSQVMSATDVSLEPFPTRI